MSIIKSTPIGEFAVVTEWVAVFEEHVTKLVMPAALVGIIPVPPDIKSGSEADALDSHDKAVDAIKRWMSACQNLVHG